MLWTLILLPLLAGAAAFALRRGVATRTLLVATAGVHAAMTAAAWMARPAAVLFGWIALDEVGLLFLSITSVLFLAASVYAVGYLRGEHGGDTSERVFTGCLLLFLAAMTVVTLSQHAGLLWVAVEATTLASAPLIYFHRTGRSLEATWKYLLICSVGIALALLGNFFLAVAAGARPLVFAELGGLKGPWLNAAFLLLLVGYGTKMGLAPLHTWLPDAHSESPSVVSALLSGAVLNCAFVGIVRVQPLCGAFGRDLLVGFGLVSMAIAAVFLLGQADFKRMLAYSSVEHMGILALGVGLGGAGAFGAMLHAVNHSLTKAMLFLVAGNILAFYQTKSAVAIRGVARVLPVSGALWLAGLLAITGSPPFGMFLSEFTILKAALDQNRPVVAVLYLLLLAIIFMAMTTLVLRMAQGDATRPRQRESALAILPPLALGAAALALGLYIPPALETLLRGAAKLLGGA